jgi:hypothetical protein
MVGLVVMNGSGLVLLVDGVLHVVDRGVSGVVDMGDMRVFSVARLWSLEGRLVMSFHGLVCDHGN